MSLVYIFISRSLSLWMVIHIQLPQSLSGVCVCVSSCLRLACNDGLPRIRHGAGIYQATELRNLDKSDMCEHASVSVCLFRLLWIPLFFFLFQPNFLSHYYSPERAAVHERAWQAGQLLRNILARDCASFICKPQFCSQPESGSALVCNYFPVDQFIYV